MSSLQRLLSSSLTQSIKTSKRRKRILPSGYVLSPSSSPFSTLTTASQSLPGERLRVAVVGGGCAGLSSALHLAPLVEKGLLASPIDIYTHDNPSMSHQRDIGVGVWSTALDPFRFEQDRPSHQLAYESLIQAGTWVTNVGYRTPDGSWLMKSHLPPNHSEADQRNMPALLFLREKDLWNSLSTAVHWEQQRGMIQIHTQQKVTQLWEQSTRPFSTHLMIENQKNKDLSLPTERDYHVIIAADGTHSLLRQQYGGHDVERRVRLTGTGALPMPLDIPAEGQHASAADWNEMQRQTGIGLQDRHYTVYRGNAPLTREEMGLDDTSFQTWGTGNSMRFATVPMVYPVGNRKEERQVWFITCDDPEIAQETNPIKRRDMLLEKFHGWHDPIRRIVEATDPNEILADRAIAHRYATSPVLNFNHVVEKMRGIRPPNSGSGPFIIFVGDAFMTIDPILAQGFTVGMEGAYIMKKAIEKACVKCERDPTLNYDPYLLEKVLKERDESRMKRLVCLLRATELVQFLGQPSGTLGQFQTKILRPVVHMIPNLIKSPIFDRVLKYSLGITPFRTVADVHGNDEDDTSKIRKI
jgi:2-polyprenyl-6-methoxyphenol hydroxylase-like FAD-dependent oxidoreductase